MDLALLTLGKQLILQSLQEDLTQVNIQLDLIRQEASQKLDPIRKIELAQFLTPFKVAQFMATLFMSEEEHIKLLDPGAGAGTLFATCVVELCTRAKPPTQISVTAYELDQELIPFLQKSAEVCQRLCDANGINFQVEIIQTNFIENVVLDLKPNLFTIPSMHSQNRYHYVILNPPYQKIKTTSTTHKYLQEIGIDVTNLYAGFLALSSQVLESDGEIVALTPRSFCNGPYFKAFRQFFLSSQNMAFTRLHLFDSRKQLFEEDAVLQENLVFHAIKTNPALAPTEVVISEGYTSGLNSPNLKTYTVPYQEVVNPHDAQRFVHIIPSAAAFQTSQKVQKLHTPLSELNLDISTGRVVEFRAKEFLTSSPYPKGEGENVPLVHPTNFKEGFSSWSYVTNGNGRKRPAFITVNKQTRNLLVPNECYVLVKRFTTKEEKRRVVAVVHEPASLPVGVNMVGFENHLNYFHQKGKGLPPKLAFGLMAFLNSTLLDNYFRQFNGHTQVNVTDLQNIGYPNRDQLETLGSRIIEEQDKNKAFPAQARLDEIVETILEFELPGQN